MAKTFIAVIDNKYVSASSQIFASPDVPEFKDSMAWKHPMLPIIHQTANVADDYKVIIINLGNEDAVKAFKTEISDMVSELVVIDGSKIKDVSDGIDLTIEILDNIENNDEVMAYVSAYANKLVDRAVHAALHAAYRLMDNVSIHHIVDVHVCEGGAEMRDMTALYQMGEITSLLRDRKLGTGIKVLKMILDR